MNTEYKGGFSSFLLKIIKIIFLYPLAFCLTIVGFMFAGEGFLILSACISEGYMAWSYIMVNIFTGLWVLSMAFCLWVAIAPKRFGYIKLHNAGWVCAILFAGAVRFTMINTTIRDSFRNARYPSYIESWPIQTLTEEKECDYNRDTVFISGYFAFLRNDFRPNANVEVIEDPTFTDSYRVEVRFKGEESELRIYHDDYEKEHHGIYQDNINIWPVVYRDNLSPSDIAYMYKHKEDITYADRMAIEKITIRTAYPEKINIENIKDRHY